MSCVARTTTTTAAATTTTTITTTRRTRRRTNTNMWQKMCGKMVTSCGMTRTSHFALHLRARAEHMNNTNAHTTIHTPYDGIAGVRSATIHILYVLIYLSVFINQCFVQSWMSARKDIAKWGTFSSLGLTSVGSQSGKLCARISHSVVTLTQNCSSLVRCCKLHQGAGCTCSVGIITGADDRGVSQMPQSGSRDWWYLMRMYQWLVGIKEPTKRVTYRRCNVTRIRLVEHCWGKGNIDGSVQP